MARKPAPWFWKARRRWFVTIDGTRHDLGLDKKAAFDRFHQMMAEPRKRQVRSDSMLTLIDAFLDWCEKHRAPDTYEWYRYRLQRFAERYPTLTADQIRPFHVQEWLDEMADLASGSKRNHCRAVKRVMRWAMQQGYIDRNPIVLMEQPKAGRREVVLSQDEFDRLLDLVPDRAFRDLLVVTWETGCRPQESLRVEARHVDLTNSRWVFPESEAKGDMLRVVYLSERAIEITRRLMLRHPEGRLFRNTRGVPWTTDSVNCAFIRHQEKMGRAIMKEQGVDIDEKSVAEFAKTLRPERMSAGVRIVKSPADRKQEARRKLRCKMARERAPKYSLYVLRHSWATHALEKGLDALTVAVLMGHRDPSTLAKVYQHLAHNPSFLLEQARKAAG